MSPLVRNAAIQLIMAMIKRTWPGLTRAAASVRKNWDGAITEAASSRARYDRMSLRLNLQ